MPPRGRAPGLKRGRNNLPYWMAKQVARDPRGFPDPCIALPPDATDDELVALCQAHTARLRAHIARHDADNVEPSLTRTRYDGSVRAACRIYQEHPLSGFQSVKHSTQATYLGSLKVIEATVGARLMRNVTVLDCRHWYAQWRKGVVTIDEDGNRILGPERIDRAHDAISMFRTVVYFMAALRHEDCKSLKIELQGEKFEKGGAREQELTYGHVAAFIKTALDLGQRGVMPYDRALYCAIATATQFELMVRQKDVIGDWAPMKVDRRYPAGIAKLELDGEIWTGFYTWENIPGWRWIMKTSKSKYRSPADFDLTRYDLLFPLLELVPHEDRTGSIVKGEGGLPVRYRSFVKWWRKIATAAGIPVDVESMDARAGGATEAQEAGVPLDAISGGMTHKKITTTLGYIRRQKRKIADIAEARSQSRGQAKTDDGTA